MTHPGIGSQREEEREKENKNRSKKINSIPSQPIEHGEGGTQSESYTPCLGQSLRTFNF